MIRLFTKDELIDEITKISKQGFCESVKKAGNDGAVGNTLESLLGITENNLPIPNTTEWELKGQREHTNSLITLKHIEPSPRAAKIVSSILLPIYGWKHKEAGKKYPDNEMSFRSTTSAEKFSKRGFRIDLEHEIGMKIKNCFYVIAESRRENNKEFFKYKKLYILSGFSFDKFLNCICNGTVLIDFDARTGHNHGTKFRIRQNSWQQIYNYIEEVI